MTEKYAIKIVPISLIIDGDVYRDGVDIIPTKVYQILETTKSVPTTSSPSLGELFVTDFAPTMGMHAGPGTLALAFYSEEGGDVG